MQLNNVVKGLALALPILALTACGSTQNNEADAAMSGTTEQTGVVEEQPTTEMEAVAPVLTPEEQQRIKFEELRQEHVIYFELDQSDVQGDYADLLEAHASYLRDHPGVNVLIEGHADERGTPEYNIALGERRAKAVAQYLEALGVLPSQLSTVSYGEEKPLDPSHTDDAFAKNRRAVLVY